jgi:membrane fusion protein (multidrug efflux system)
MFLTVSMLKDDVEALMIPEQAVVPERSKQYVFIMGEDNIVERREISTGRRRPGQVAVTAGLSPGDLVIAEGTQRVKPGQPATITGRIDEADSF